VVENNVDRSSKQVVGRLTDLKCWPEVQAKIRAGDKSGTIARWIQDEAKELLDHKTDSVRRMVARERELMAVGDSQPEQKKGQVEIDKLKKELEEVKQAEVTDKTKKRKLLNVLEEISELYELQMERVKVGRKVEITMGYLIRTLTSDVAEAREILKFAFEVDREMGISKRPPEEVGDGKRFETLTYEARKRVLQALDMVKSKLKVMEIEERRIEKASEEVVEAEVVRTESPDSVDSPTDSEGLPFE
jgi:hypothetical protein